MFASQQSSACHVLYPAIQDWTWGKARQGAAASQPMDQAAQLGVQQPRHGSEAGRGQGLRITVAPAAAGGWEGCCGCTTGMVA